MQYDSDLYREVADVYALLVERDSPAAAEVIGAIQRKEGTHAAFLATLIIAVLKQELEDDSFQPNPKAYAYLFKDYPEGVWLLEEAIIHYLHDWGLPDATIARITGNSERLISAPSDTLQPNLDKGGL